MTSLVFKKASEKIVQYYFEAVIRHGKSEPFVKGMRPSDAKKEYNIPELIREHKQTIIDEDSINTFWKRYKKDFEDFFIQRHPKYTVKKRVLVYLTNHNIYGFTHFIRTPSN